eukprot:s259_g38.t1
MNPLLKEVVIQAPRKFDITRILRYKVQMRATNPLLYLNMNFGVRLAFDKGQAGIPGSPGVVRLIESNSSSSVTPPTTKVY